MKQVDIYRLNTPKVIFENLDGNVLVINLETGNYFSMVEEGAEIWDLLVARNPLPQLIAKLSSRYSGNKSEIKSSAETFVSRLLEEGLLVPEKGKATAEQFSNDSGQGFESKKPFTPPILEKYTDMRETLLVDPIHEVDESGWPIEADN